MTTLPPKRFCSVEEQSVPVERVFPCFHFPVHECLASSATSEITEPTYKVRKKDWNKKQTHTKPECQTARKLHSRFKSSPKHLRKSSFLFQLFHCLYVMASRLVKTKVCSPERDPLASVFMFEANNPLSVSIVGFLFYTQTCNIFRTCF